MRAPLGSEAVLTVEGDGFVAGRVRVLVGTHEARDVVVSDAGRLTCVSPPLASGAHTVLVQRDDGREAALVDAIAAERLGLPDPTFGPGGLRTRATPSISSVIASDASGRTYSIRQPDATQFVVARRTVAGDDDATYAFTPIAGERGRLITIDSQQRLLVASTSLSDRSLLVLRRFLADGTLDPTFGVGGAVARSLFDGVGFLPRALFVDGQDRVVLSCRRDTSSFRAARILRWTALGVPDATYGVGGACEPAPADFRRAGGSEFFCDAAIDGLGRVVLILHGYRGVGQQTILVRATVDGQPDPTFGTGGVVVLDSVFVGVPLVAANARGRIVTSTMRTFVRADGVRVMETSLRAFDALGAPDTTFGAGGRLVLASGTVALSLTSWARSLAFDPRTDELIVAGQLPAGGAGTWVLDSLGRFHPATPAGGSPLPAGAGLTAEALTLDAFGRAVVVGGTSTWRVR